MAFWWVALWSLFQVELGGPWTELALAFAISTLAGVLLGRWLTLLVPVLFAVGSIVEELTTSRYPIEWDWGAEGGVGELVVVVSALAIWLEAGAIVGVAARKLAGVLARRPKARVTAAE